MKPVAFFLLTLFISCKQPLTQTEKDYTTPFETSNGQRTANYQETIDFYLQLAQDFSEINVQTIGTTDSGLPLHMVTYNSEGDFNHKKIGLGKTMILINNGIHPGESDGIDATMMLFRDFATGTLKPLENTILVTIPIYNIGGALNRNSTTRANQNGPESYGFRGNSLNYDLNRDFIKTDTHNAKTFTEIFHLINPDIFIDNHVSNGADYQYTLTHLFTQHNKMGGKQGTYIKQTLLPALEDSLHIKNLDITPYVNVFNRPPDSGFSQFMDTPRYSTGYTTLWNTIGLMVETHMLKPYKQRVTATYELMKSLFNIAEAESEQILSLRENTFNKFKEKEYYPLQWKIDSTRHSVLNFKGFTADTVTSTVTGLPRLKYDRNKPYVKDVVYWDYYIPSDSVRIPQAYVLKKNWKKVIDQLVLNKIGFKTIPKDTTLRVESYKIKEYSTVTDAYEGHYLHYDTQIIAQVVEKVFEEGDLIIPTDQPGFRYLMETLEPKAVDSFFNWNFFDTLLQQKEGFSPYVFEDTAAHMLENDSVLQREFQSKKINDSHFASNSYAQLDWLFKKSKYYEKEHKQYPVYRLLGEKSQIE